MINKLTKMITKINRRFVGFTLSEVIVTSSLLVIAIVPILKALTAGHLGTTIIEHKTYSLMLAQSKLDEIKADSVYRYSGTFSESDVSVGGRYFCNIDDIPSGSDLRKIRVSVGYDLDGDDRLASSEVSVVLSTLIAKRW